MRPANPWTGSPDAPRVEAPPPSKRARLARALDLLGLLDRLLWARARLGLRTLATLTYHRVGRIDGASDLADHVIEVEPEALENQIAVIREHCTIVSFSDLRRFQRGGRVPPNPVLLTFDDGYADNHAVALPILAKMGAPATFFIPTAYPDAGRLFWWDRVTLLMRRSQVDRADLVYPRKLVLSPRADPDRAARLVCKAINTTRGVSLGRLWEDLESALGVSLGSEEERSLARGSIMGWSQVRALAAAGMDVEAHSHRHLVLNTLTPDEALRDLKSSAAILGEALGRPVHGVAYPVGYELHGELRRVPGAAGFELGFTNATGLGTLRQLDPMNIPRVSMDLDAVGALYKMLLLLGDRIMPGGRPAPEQS